MKSWLRSLLPYLTSAVVHAIVVGGLAAGTLFVARKILSPPPAEIELVVLSKAPEPPEDKPKERTNAVRPPPAVKPPPRLPPRRKRRPPKMLAEPPPENVPPRVQRLASLAQPTPESRLPDNEPVRPGSAAPTVFGIDMDSADSKGGTFEVAQGNTVATNPGNTGPVLGDRGRPEGSALVAPAKALPEPIDDTKITTWPSRTDDLVFRYPEAARRRGTEGSVKLRLTLDEEGNVLAAVLVKPADPLLDAVALEGAKKLLFSPAVAGKKPVPCEIPYTFTFVLD